MHNLTKYFTYILAKKKREKDINFRAIIRSENPEGHIVLGGDNVPPLVELSLTDLSKSGPCPPLPLLATGL